VGEETSIDLEQWLRRGAWAARRGDLVSARRIFRALARIAPSDRRVWIGLARVAESSAEREEALHHVATIVAEPLPPPLHPSDHSSDSTQASALRKPDHSADSAQLPALPVSATVAETTLPPPLAPVPPRDQPVRSRRSAYRWLLATLIALAIGLLGFGSWFRSDPTISSSSPNLPPSLAAIGPLPTPLATGIVVITQVIPSPSPLPPTPSPVPTSSPEPNMRPVGQLIDHDNWQIGLLRPEDIVIIDGELGMIQPAGRLLIVLIAVSNEAMTDRRLPANLFMLEDDAGQRYYPLSEASSRYLEQFGRGLYGDLALEDVFTAQSGLRSVPLLFDVPTHRAPVRLWVGGEGWTLR